MSACTGDVPQPLPLPLAVKFSTAGLGGILGWIVVHPINTVFVQMNLAQGQAVVANSASATASKQDNSMLPFMRKIVKERGVMSLYSGLSAGIIRQIFYASSRFGLFEIIRDEIEKYRETDIASRLFAGCTSGGIAALISCPAEVTLVRMANDANLPVDQRRNYSGVVNAATRILKEEGAMTFFSGVAPFVQRAMLVGAVQIGTYDQFKASYNSLLGLVGFSNVFAASMSSGLLYSLVTMPFETARINSRARARTPQQANFCTRAHFRRWE